jgi:DNA-binding Xre family transcriptional regulator
MSLEININQYLSQLPAEARSLKGLGLQVGVSPRQMQAMAAGKQNLISRRTLAKIISYMRANGLPNIDVGDLLKYAPD